MKKLNLTKKEINTIVKELEPTILKLYFYDDLICPYCLRSIPSKKHLTEISNYKKCLWCDIQHHKIK
jgi:hypothetical protein